MLLHFLVRVSQCFLADGELDHERPLNAIAHLRSLLRDLLVLALAHLLSGLIFLLG
jgi:hypothetical protein